VVHPIQEGDADLCGVDHALGVIDHGPTANGVDPLDGLRYIQAKRDGDK
jgi:hypothetical protein